MKFVLVNIFLVMFGCKAANWAKLQPSNRQVSAMLTPQKIASVDLADVKDPATFELDSETGRIKSVLMLRLDYFPKTEGGETTLPLCLSPLAGKFVVGYAECIDFPGLSKNIYAENVNQSCYTDETIPLTRASIPFTMVGCSQAVAVAHRFDPALMLDVELR